MRDTLVSVGFAIIIFTASAGCIATGSGPATPADLVANATTQHTTPSPTNATTPPASSAASFYALATVTPPASANGSATITIATVTTSPDANATSARPLRVAAIAIGWDVTRLDLGADPVAGIGNALAAMNDTLTASSITFRGANETASWTVPVRTINATGSVDAPIAIILLSPDTGRVIALGLDGHTVIAWTDNVVNGEIVGHSWARVQNAVLNLTT